MSIVPASSAAPSSGAARSGRSSLVARVGSAASVLLVLIATNLLFVPWRPEIAGEGLDASFRHALHELEAEGIGGDTARFGVDIVHQYGPYGFAVNDQFHPETYAEVVALRSALAAVLGALIAWLAVGLLRPWWLGLAWAVPTTIVVSWFDVPYLLLPQLALLAFTHAAGPRLRIGLLALATPAMALVSLMKFNALLMCVATLGLVVVLSLASTWAERRGRPQGLTWLGAGHDPRHAAAWAGAYGLSVGVLWLLDGQRLLDLPAFLAGGLRLSAGYSASHALSGPLGHVASFLAFVGLFWLVIAVSEIRRLRAVGLAHALVLAAFVFLSFKHAFVRHDPPHGAMGVMYSLAAVLVWGAVVTRLETSRTRPTPDGRAPDRAVVGRWRRLVAPALAVTVSLAVVGWAHVHLGYYRWPAAGLVDLLDRRIGVAGTRLATLDDFARDPLWRAEAYESDRELQRAKYPLPPLEGTVDLFPYRLNILFAHDLDYAPRPLLQSYQASDPWLAERNARRYVDGGEAPEHVVVGVTPIDQRLATMDDSLIWPHLLTDYRLRDASYGFVVLDRAPAAARLERLPARSIQAGFNEWIELDPSSTAPDDALLWLETDVDRTLAGRLVGFLFREPLLYVELRFVGGETATYRYLPGIGDAGFMLSPVVESWIDFAALYDDDPSESLTHRRVEAMRFVLKKTWSFDEEIGLELTPIAIDRRSGG